MLQNPDSVSPNRRDAVTRQVPVDAGAEWSPHRLVAPSVWMHVRSHASMYVALAAAVSVFATLNVANAQIVLDKTS